jgi:transcriptional regulator with XRE-family HTH domain
MTRVVVAVNLNEHVASIPVETHQEPTTPEVLFGAAMRHYRELRRMSQQAFANRMQDKGLRWGQSTVAKTEAAERPIRLNEAVAIGEILGVRLAEMVREYHDEVAVALRQVLEARGRLERLENDLREMDNERRRRRDAITHEKTVIEHLRKQLDEVMAAHETEGEAEDRGE